MGVRLGIDFYVTEKAVEKGHKLVLWYFGGDEVRKFYRPEEGSAGTEASSKTPIPFPKVNHIEADLEGSCWCGIIGIGQDTIGPNA